MEGGGEGVNVIWNEIQKSYMDLFSQASKYWRGKWIKSDGEDYV